MSAANLVDAAAAQGRPDEEEGAIPDPDRLARSSSEDEEEASPKPTEEQESTGPIAQEEEVQGGGAEGAAVSGKYRSYTVSQQEGTGHIKKVTFYYEDKSHVVKKRPAQGSSDEPIWQLLEAQHKHCKKLKKDSETLGKIEEVFYQRHALHATATAPAPAPAQAAQAGAEREKHTYTVASKPLRASARAEVERRYFLQIEEDTKAPDGREYAPFGKSGSLCGGFPHMVTLPARAKNGAAKVYGVSQNHRIGLRIQLMERVPGGGVIKASEFELLKYIHAQYPPTQVAGFDHFEKTLTLFATLEFDKGGLVGSSDFKHGPPCNSIWSPPESPPYYAGSTERVMEGGVVYFKKLWLNKRVTSANLDEEVVDRKFRVVVKTLNSALHDLKGFTATSLPFAIKSVMHNDVAKKQRFVRNTDGSVVPLV